MTPKTWAQKRNWSKAELTGIRNRLVFYKESRLMTFSECLSLNTALKAIETVLKFWPAATKLSRKENVK